MAYSISNKSDERIKSIGNLKAYFLLILSLDEKEAEYKNVKFSYFELNIFNF